jgi:hypothetical protein
MVCLRNISVDTLHKGDTDDDDDDDNNNDYHHQHYYYYHHHHFKFIFAYHLLGGVLW